MSILFFLLGLILGAIGFLIFIYYPGIAAIQGGILMIVATLFLVGGAILERLDQVRRDIGLASAEAVKALLAGVKEQ